MPESSQHDAQVSRRASRCRLVLAWIVRCVLFGIVLGYVMAQALTDSYQWSQWLFFVPAEAWLLATWAAAAAVAALEPPGRMRRWARTGPLLVAILVSLHVATFQWRLHNALLRTPGPTVLRVYHWNATEATDEALQRFLRDADPFGLRHDSPAVVVLANPPLRLDWLEITAMLAGEPISTSDTTRFLRRGGGRFVVLSGAPVTASGWASLGLQGKTAEGDLMDNGKAMFVRLQGPFGETVLWAWDWPSDPSRGRMSFAAPSIEAISASTHASFSRTAAGPLRREEIKGFPPPDIAVGDFNTARGSAAVAGVLPGLASAHAQGGIGPDYGWPRFVRSNNVDRATIPFIGVDQAFVRRERWRATAYRMIDMGVGTHRAQEVILTTADR